MMQRKLRHGDFLYKNQCCNLALYNTNEVNIVTVIASPEGVAISFLLGIASSLCSSQ
jgi:hypothetical protein